MKHEAWEKVCHLLNQEELVWVFRDVLDRNELSNLLKESKLSWLTTRLEGATLEDLAERSSRAFRTNPHVARTAVEILDGKTLAARERIAHQSGREMRESLAVSGTMVSEGKVGEIFWGLAQDERQEINEGLDELRGGLLHLLRSSGWRKEEPKGHDDEAIQKLTIEMAAARDESEAQKAKLVKYEQLEEEVKDLRHENEGLRQIRADQEKELTKLQAEILEAASDSNILGRMEREVRRLAFTLEKVEAQLGQPRETNQTERGLLERLDAWHEDLAVWGQARGKSEEETLALLGEVRDRLAALTVPSPGPAEQDEAPSVPEKRAERVAVFVDGQSMYFGARHAGGKLDFKRFLEGAVQGRTLVKAVAYLVQGEKDVGGLAGLLRRYGYEVRVKERGPATAPKREGWEMEIAMDIIASLGEVDAVALGSGEEEFAGLAEFLKSRAIRFEVLAFPETVSPVLRGMADAFYPMGEEMVMRFDR
jgi:uncharacterized LabA/DUF88 family protein